MDPSTWVVRAVNLAEHARNPIHTDAGAQAAGFERALVAGVTTYAYLTHPLMVAWGEHWLANGGGEVRFRSPVFVDDEVRCTPSADGDITTVDALVDGEVRATFASVRDSGPILAMRNGEPLRSRQIPMVGEFGDEYGSRAGDDLDLSTRLGLVHPAVWPAFANHLVHAEVARGAWVHTRSIIRHHGVAHVGDTADVHGVVVRRFDTRGGERAVLDVRIEVAGAVVATLEHEAIVALPGL
ncbi:MAG: MaoC family dehydratase [Ilumatobacteraceae bacterium]